jgi:hypothetical protein
MDEGALHWAGVVLGPAVGAALMSASAAIVALNARLLRMDDNSRTTEQAGTEKP